MYLEVHWSYSSCSKEIQDSIK